MEGSLGSMLLLQLLLIALNAVFACAEIAVLSMNENKIDQLVSQGNKRARRLQRLIREPAKFLSAIQVAITLSGFLGSAFAAENFSDVLVNWLMDLGVAVPYKTLDAIAVVLITLILSYITLIFGELVPKRVAMRKTEAVALGVSGVVNAISRIFAPLIWLLSVSTNGVLRLIGIDPNEEDEQVSEEEIRMMVDAGSEKGAIDHEEKEFIQNVFEFDDLTAEEIATHRTEVDLLWMEESMEDWARTIHETRHTLYPVCRESADQIVGILNAKDYFRLEDKSREKVLAMAVKPPYFVPESIKADVLFRNMKRNRFSMAVVLDEYGGVVGIITLNDLIEQLVGDLQDDEEIEVASAPRILKMSEDTFTVRGNIELDDLEEALGFDFDRGESDTLTGIVFSALGAVPADGPQDVSVALDGFSVQVLRVKDHQIADAVLRVLPKEEENEEDDED